ncbi:unnamed protein product [Paramecium pentaurelia]|uniref:Uncharacterized protein n=1 Tax=Paramecium pentaurelia TaxID=43138 RepID=A0A8S1XPZ4_9CILI|nr:unnamed protein product [Paramecium pentaurelia]
MKYIAILLLILALTNATNMRQQQKHKEVKKLVELDSSFVGETQDLSGNVGMISVIEETNNDFVNQNNIKKAETKERNAVLNAIKKSESHKSLIQLKDNEIYVEETLDQTPKKDINFADLFTNDGSSPDMGQQVIFEDSPSAPMAQLPQDENLEYVRAIDKFDLLDENGQPLQLLPEEQTLLEMKQFESRFQQDETPQMDAAPTWDLESAYEKTPGQSELSPEELQRQTEQMVDSLKGELEDENI